MKYEVWGVADHGDTLKHPTGFILAPTNNQLCEWAHHHKLAFVVRYYPSKKGWRALDTRVLERVYLRRHSSAKVCVHHALKEALWSLVYPNVDAALMTLTHRHSWPQNLVTITKTVR